MLTFFTCGYNSFINCWIVLCWFVIDNAFINKNYTVNWLRLLEMNTWFLIFFSFFLSIWFELFSVSKICPSIDNDSASSSMHHWESAGGEHTGARSSFIGQTVPPIWLMRLPGFLRLFFLPFRPFQYLNKLIACRWCSNNQIK